MCKRCTCRHGAVLHLLVHSAGICVSASAFCASAGLSAVTGPVRPRLFESRRASWSVPMATGASIEGKDKSILFVRHGVTEMNEFLASSHYGSAGFKDPGFWDTKLTARGVAQAEALNRRLAASDRGVDLLVCSPLTRALHTASLAFAGHQFKHVPRFVHAGIRERMWLSSDVGSPSSVLAQSWSDEGWDFTSLEECWWHTDSNWRQNDWRAPGEYLAAGEPESPFCQRLVNFKEWLFARSEGRIAVVAHWGVIYGLTGKSLDNCEALELRLDDFNDLQIFVTD